ncbi:MAG: nucleotidyltransferase family protein [Lachnospiraceae bacterium]|nr:nucleotidyltransferase family protein [Lachnospiraceae bacterium]
MRTVGIIAEYNPFHTGHEYHIQKAKELADADYAVVVMSPDFVQRGEPAIFDKYTRARMALQCGADLVVELPVCYATGSAEYFAEGAVRILDALGVVNALCFGAEAADISRDSFLDIAALLLEEPAAYQDALKGGLRKGLTFPKARAEAVRSCLNSDAADTLLSSPNNILGVEYCKALQKLHSSITPIPLKRKGSPYSDQQLGGDYCSAGAIRSTICKNFDSDGYSSLSRYIPAACKEFFGEACRTPVFPDELLPILTQKLICTNDNFPSAENAADSFTGKPVRHLTETHFDGILDISSALSARMEKLRFDCVGKSYNEIATLIKSKQITEAHVRRALLHLILDIRKSDVETWRTNGGVFYAHLLGFRQDAAPLLHDIKIKSALPLISKAAHAPGLLSDMGLQMWNQDTAASHLYRSLRTLRYGTPFLSEYEISPIRM